VASDRFRSRRVRLSWRADDGERGSGITSYRVERRELGTSAWIPIAGKTDLTRASYRGGAGRAYAFRVSAVDRANNRGTSDSERLAIPVDDRDKGLFKFSRGWKRLKRKGAWGGTVRRSSRAHASARIRVGPGRVVVVGRKLRKGGKLRVTVRGRSKVVRLRGKGRFRAHLFKSRPLPEGTHLMRLKALGSVEIDAVAVVR
jgi:hypothetical protein